MYQTEWQTIVKCVFWTEYKAVIHVRNGIQNERNQRVFNSEQYFSNRNTDDGDAKYSEQYAAVTRESYAELKKKWEKKKEKKSRKMWILISPMKQ